MFTITVHCIAFNTMALQYFHTFKQQLITAIMLIKGLGDLNTEVIFSLLHLKADLKPE